MTATSPANERILFVCVENSCRSQIAEAFARMYGGNRVEPYSAGSRPSGQVHPRAIESMREIGYDLTQHASKSLSQLPSGKYDIAVTMGCGDECPIVQAMRRESWDIPDPKTMAPQEFRRVRGLIEQKVKALLDSLT
jgi:arsenate reductase (thioredoxin)